MDWISDYIFEVVEDELFDNFYAWINLSLNSLKIIYSWALCGPLIKHESQASLLYSLQVYKIHKFSKGNLWDLHNLGSLSCIL
jgi:hypothetical protein